METKLGCFRCGYVVTVKMDRFFNKELPEGWVCRTLTNDIDMTPGCYVICNGCIKKENQV